MPRRARTLVGSWPAADTEAIFVLPLKETSARYVIDRGWDLLGSELSHLRSGSVHLVAVSRLLTATDRSHSGQNREPDKDIVGSGSSDCISEDCRLWRRCRSSRVGFSAARSVGNLK
jgi:hypothetical protein